jgi:hypothetical protein
MTERAKLSLYVLRELTHGHSPFKKNTSPHIWKQVMVKLTSKHATDLRLMLYICNRSDVYSLPSEAHSFLSKNILQLPLALSAFCSWWQAVYMLKPVQIISSASGLSWTDLFLVFWFCIASTIPCYPLLAGTSISLKMYFAIKLQRCQNLLSTVGCYRHEMIGKGGRKRYGYWQVKEDSL